MTRTPARHRDEHATVEVTDLDPPQVRLRSEGFLIFTMISLTAVAALIGALGAPLIPLIARDIDVSVGTAQWILTAPTLVGAVALPVVGRLGNGARRRKTMIGAGLAVCVGCLLSALPFGFTVILLGRVLQGFGLCMLPLTLAVIRESVSAKRQAGALMAVSASMMVGSGIGNPVTTLVATFAGFRGAYWFGFAVMAITMTVVLLCLPDSALPDRRVEWRESILLATGTAAVLIAISQGNEWGWLSPRMCSVTVVGVLVLAIWWRKAWRSPVPMVNVRLAVSRSLLGANLTVLLVGAAVYALLSLLTLVVQLDRAQGGLGQTALTVGLLLVPYSAAGALGTWIVQRLGVAPSRMLPFGALFYALSMVVFALWRDSLWQLVIVMVLSGIGSGGTFAVLPIVVVDHSPSTEVSAALSANQVVRFLGFSIGSAVSVAVVSQVSGATPTAWGFTVAALVAAAMATVAGVVALALLWNASPGRR